MADQGLTLPQIRTCAAVSAVCVCARACMYVMCCSLRTTAQRDSLSGCARVCVWAVVTVGLEGPPWQVVESVLVVVVAQAALLGCAIGVPFHVGRTFMTVPPSALAVCVASIGGIFVRKHAWSSHLCVGVFVRACSCCELKGPLRL